MCKVNSEQRLRPTDAQWQRAGRRRRAASPPPGSDLAGVERHPFDMKARLHCRPPEGEEDGLEPIGLSKVTVLTKQSETIHRPAAARLKRMRDSRSRPAKAAMTKPKVKVACKLAHRQSSGNSHSGGLRRVRREQTGGPDDDDRQGEDMRQRTVDRPTRNAVINVTPTTTIGFSASLRCHASRKTISAPSRWSAAPRRSAAGQ